MLAIGNLVPAPSEDGLARCARCGVGFRHDNRGAFCAEPCGALVCDSCGGHERSELLPLVAALRAPGRFPSAFTVTIVGAVLELDADALRCPLCGDQRDEESRVEWHVVDGRFGRPVCGECLADVDPVIVELRERLQRSEGRDLGRIAMPA